MSFTTVPCSGGGLSVSDVQGVISGSSGWAVYRDSLHTLANPQTITQGTTGILTNDADLIIDSEIPYDATGQMWDVVTSKILPIRENDYYSWILRFKAKNSVGNGGYMNVGIDIGGTFGTIFLGSHSFIRGANVEQSFNIKLDGYTGSTFMVNGGIPKLTSSNGTTIVYDKEFHFIRTHRGR